MPGKDDLFANRTLWLGRENAEQARDNYWHAFERYWRETGPPLVAAGRIPQKSDWDIAWAAAIAAHSYIWEGNLGPPVGKQPESAVDS